MIVAVLALGALIRDRLCLCMFLACFGMLLRNSAIALVATVTVTVLLDSSGTRIAARRGLLLVAGGLMPLLALVWWNLWVLGTFTPYHMSPSRLGFWTNARAMGRAIAFDLAPITSLADALPSLAIYAVCLILAIGLIIDAMSRYPGPSSSRRARLSLALYFCLGTTMTVIARTRYEWGEIIWARHAAQYDWLLLPLAMFSIGWARVVDPRRITLLLCTATVAFLGIRAEDIGSRLITVSHARPAIARTVQTGVVEQGTYAQLRQMFRAYQNVEGLNFVKTASDNGCVILSNIADLLVAQYDVTAADINSLNIAHTGSAHVVLIATLYDPAGAMPSPPANMAELTIDRLPGSIKVFSDQPDACLANVEWSPLTIPESRAEGLNRHQ